MEKYSAEWPPQRKKHLEPLTETPSHFERSWIPVDIRTVKVRRVARISHFVSPHSDVTNDTTSSRSLSILSCRSTHYSHLRSLRGCKSPAAAVKLYGDTQSRNAGPHGRFVTQTHRTRHLGGNAVMNVGVCGHHSHPPVLFHGRRSLFLFFGSRRSHSERAA